MPKYFTKAEHGFFHSLAFTTGEFHEPIQIKERSRRVTENSCRKCHQDIVHDIDTYHSIRRHHVLHSLPRERGPSEIETLMSNLTFKERLLNFYRHDRWPCSASSCSSPPRLR